MTDKILEEYIIEYSILLLQNGLPKQKLDLILEPYCEYIGKQPTIKKEKSFQKVLTNKK